MLIIFSQHLQNYWKDVLVERSPEFKRLFREGKARDTMSEHFLKMVIYYDNLNYYKYSEEPVMEVSYYWFAPSPLHHGAVVAYSG